MSVQTTNEITYKVAINVLVNKILDSKRKMIEKLVRENYSKEEIEDLIQTEYDNYNIIDFIPNKSNKEEKKDLVIPSHIKVILSKNGFFNFFPKNKEYNLNWKSWEIPQENYKEMLDYQDIENLRDQLYFVKI